jgi:hypothetical protein
VALENFLKKNYITRDDIESDDADDLGAVIRNKVASEKAFCKLFAAALTQADVPFHIVLTGDRENFMLDRNFENWNNASNMVFYFPSTRKFLAPTSGAYRYPWIPATWTGTNALFCVTTSLGNLKTAIAEIKPVPAEAYEYNYLNLDVKAKFEKDMDALILDMRHSYSGYAMADYKSPFVFYPAEEQKNFLKELIKFGTNSENILNHSFENKEIDQKDPYQPFVIKASVRSAQMVEKAGQKLIVKDGQFIGEQTQMYEEQERTQKVDLDYPHALVRTIEIEIPEGYVVKNADDLIINKQFKEKDVVTMGFVSGYTIDGNQLKITIREDYRLNSYPLNNYEQFKEVINAAADFNKVVLVLDRKS